MNKTAATIGETSKFALAKIASVGIGLPERVMHNTDLEKLVETSDQWIVERTGIRERRIVDKGTTCSDLAAIAALDAIKKAGLTPDDIELIIVATVTPDMMLPATACLVQNKIGAKKAWGFDLSIACSGFLYAMQVGVQFVASGAHKNVLVIGMDIMSSIIDYTDRQTCIIFGDGGGAAVIQPSQSKEDGCFIDFLHEVDGSGGEFLCVPGGGSQNPPSADTIDKRMHYLKQDGPVVFKFATKRMPEICARLLERNGLTGADIDLFVPHQANLRIIKSAVDRLVGLPMEKVVVNIDKYGNTTAGTLPLALDSALQDGRLKKGDLVLFAAMGAGLSAGAALMRWGY
jgi:3-oxoacyl-[acyl-carrier-protein] synthase-3